MTQNAEYGRTCPSMENGTPLTCDLPRGHDGPHSYDDPRLNQPSRYRDSSRKCGAGHRCCSDPSRPPLHDHFLSPEDCPRCQGAEPQACDVYGCDCPGTASDQGGSDG